MAAAAANILPPEILGSRVPEAASVGVLGWGGRPKSKPTQQTPTLPSHGICTLAEVPSHRQNLKPWDSPTGKARAEHSPKRNPHSKENPAAATFLPAPHKAHRQSCYPGGAEQKSKSTDRHQWNERSSILAYTFLTSTDSQACEESQQHERERWR